MSLVFVRKGETLIPAMVKSGYIIDVDTIENDSMWNKNRDDLEKLSKSDLIDLLSRGDGIVRDDALDKKRGKMTKSALIDDFLERFDTIKDNVTGISNIMKRRKALAKAVGDALTDASSSGDAQPPSHGYEKLQVHAKRAGDVKAYRVFMASGHVMVSTAYGSYQVAKPEELLEWLLTHNHVMLPREDAKEEHDNVEKDTNSSACGDGDDACSGDDALSDFDFDDLPPLSPRYMQLWDEDIRLIGIKLVQPQLSMTVAMYVTVLEVKALICKTINEKQSEEKMPISETDIILKHGLTKMEDDCKIETYTANGDVLTVSLELRVRGGGKRARINVQEESDGKPKTLRDLKDAVRSGIVQLKSIQSPSPASIETIEKAEFILRTVETNPSTAASNLIAHIPREKLGAIVAGTIPAGTRPTARLRYVAEQSMPDLFLKLENLTKQEQVATLALCNSVHCAIVAEHGDHQGQIGWSTLFKAMLERITNPPSEESNNNSSNHCCLM